MSPKGTPTIQPAKGVEYETPRDLFDQLWREFGGFDLDPASLDELAAADASCEHGEGLSIEAFFGDLFRGISAHFALEERFMLERRYDQLAQHKADHERLLDEIRDLMDRYEDDRSFDEQELARRLSAWFAVHFGSHDARLHRRLART